MIKDYEEKLNQCLLMQNYKCPVCKNDLLNGGKKVNIIIDKIDLHHLMRRTKGNIKRYPLMIDSVKNLEAVHHLCHLGHHGSCGKLSDIEAEAIEKRMREELNRKHYEDCEAFYNNQPKGIGE